MQNKYIVLLALGLGLFGLLAVSVYRMKNTPTDISDKDDASSYEYFYDRQNDPTEISNIEVPKGHEMLSLRQKLHDNMKECKRYSTYFTSIQKTIVDTKTIIKFGKGRKRVSARHQMFVLMRLLEYFSELERWKISITEAKSIIKKRYEFQEHLRNTTIHGNYRKHMLRQNYIRLKKVESDIIKLNEDKQYWPVLNIK